MANNLSYTGKDIADIRRELINLIPQLTTKWTDFNESDLGMVWLELLASVSDMQNFYMDTQALETFLDTAVQSKNIRSLLRAMNYPVPLVHASSGYLQIDFENNSYKEITIPKYTPVTSSSYTTKVDYCVAEDVSVSGEINTLKVPIMEGQPKVLTMTRSDFLNNVNTSGNTSRRVYLGYTSVASRGIQIIQDGTYLWKQVEDALLEYKGGRLYSVHKDSDGQVYVLMSVNFLDYLTDDSTLVFSFVISLGSDGNIPANTLDTIGVPLSGVTRITNPLKMSGGADEPNLQDLKILARKNAVTMGRYITVEDYETGVRKNPAVSDCYVVDWKTPKYVLSPYLIKVWAVGYDGQELPSTVENEIRADLEENGIVGNTIEFMPVETTDFEISCTVYTNSRNEQEKALIKSNIRAYLDQKFKPEAVSFGQGVSLAMLSSVFRAVSTTITDVVFTSPTNDITVEDTGFIRLVKSDIQVVSNRVSK